MPLARTSTPAGLVTMLASIPPSGGTVTIESNWWGRPTGSTPPPTNTRAPKFTFGGLAQSAPQGVDPARLKFMGKLDAAASNKITLIQPAAEGDGVSYYLAPGVYEINYGFDRDLYDSIVSDNPETAGNMANFLTKWEPETPRVWVIVSQEIAMLNKAAEEEHCSDIRLAYDLTIGKAQALASSGTFQGDVRSAYGGNGLWMCDPDKCLAKFREVLFKTAKRDAGWHTFQIGPAHARDAHGLHEFPQASLPAAPQERVYVKMETSETTKIGVVPSAQIITL